MMGDLLRLGHALAHSIKYERQGLVYVRGYRTHDRQTPFKEGYLLTWINANLPREDAIAQAVERTDRALEGRAATSPTIQRVYRIRDMIFGATRRGISWRDPALCMNWDAQITS